MSGLSGFLAMGGYAAYVWPAYGLSLLVLGLLLWRVLASLRQNEAALLAADETADTAVLRPRVAARGKAASTPTASGGTGQ